MEVRVLGLGHIGLPTAAACAARGLKVLGIDRDEKVIANAREGLHISEPGLAEAVRLAVASGNLRFSSKVEPGDVFIIAVPTPITPDYCCEMEHVVKAVESILAVLREGDTVLIESTVGPGDTASTVQPLLEKAGFVVGKSVYLAHCPERVMPGQVMQELVDNPRVVGGVTPACSVRAAELYRRISRGEIILTDSTTAEMVKLTENTFRDVNIALANELVKICNHLRINGLAVIEYANMHPRVNLHQPGPGVGGHCLAVDPYFIIEKAPELSPLIALSRRINSSMPSYISDFVAKLPLAAGATLSILGVSYRGNIADVRESPGLKVVDNLSRLGFKIRIHDPHAKPKGYDLYSLEEALTGADLAVVLADHAEFRTLSAKTFRNLMRQSQILDTKGIIDVKAFLADGVAVWNLGTLNKSCSFFPEVAATGKGARP